jgi:alkylation response protein AidB-like acyl-CoA dehydrogenase
MVLDMHQPGVEVRPLREMTGRAMFNEVFLTDVRVPDDAVIGGRNNGWAVANTTLAFERTGLGTGAGSEAVSPATPGTVSGDLDRRVGDFVGPAARQRGSGGPGAFHGAERLFVDLARANGSIADPSIRQDLAHLHTQMEIGRYLALRQKAARAAGGDLPGIGNIAKLSMSKICRLTRDLGPRILGPLGMLHAYSPEAREALDAATGQPAAGHVTEISLFAPGPSIYGGTDEIQKNIIGERVLGLPKEPNRDRVTPFRDLPKNV